MQNKNLGFYTKAIILTALFLAAFLERTVFDLGPNIELVTTTMILSSYFFGRMTNFWLTLWVVALSDLIIGNSGIFIFTWSGFLIPAFFSKTIYGKLSVLSKTLSGSRIFKPLLLTATGMGANIFFYFWTNFGVWLISPMYAKTFAGLLMSYINGLPFLRPQILSSILFIPAGYLLTEIYFRFERSVKHYFSYTFNSSRN